MDNKLPVKVFSIKEYGNLKRVVLGESIGTQVRLTVSKRTPYLLLFSNTMF